MGLLFGIYGCCFLAVGDILWAYFFRHSIWHLFYFAILFGIHSGISSGILGFSGGILSGIYFVTFSLTWALPDRNHECQISVGSGHRSGTPG